MQIGFIGLVNVGATLAKSPMAAAADRNGRKLEPWGSSR